MARHVRTIIVLAFVAGVAVVALPRLASSQDEKAAAEPPVKSRLAVLWTSADPDVAHNVCFMYTGAAKSNKWFDDVVLIVWGPSAKLTAEDARIQAAVKSMMDKGVKVQACVACANKYGVADDLRKLGIEVKGMGGPLTEILRSDWKVLTF